MKNRITLLVIVAAAFSLGALTQQQLSSNLRKVAWYVQIAALQVSAGDLDRPIDPYSFLRGQEAGLNYAANYVDENY